MSVKITELMPFGLAGLINTTIWYLSLSWLEQLTVDIRILESEIYDLEWKITEKQLVENEECIRP